MAKMLPALVLTVGLLSAAPGLSASAEEGRDPFAPVIVGTEAKPSPNSTDFGISARKELTSYSVMSYRLIGVIRAEHTSIAVVQTRDKRKYMVRPGEALGNEGGIIEAISVAG
ncbi:MAG: pilus assembly protein PilP, partial [Rickettsiales bacterium]|nr:pilus assembly protein PilP [Rickettsiales bacterium]